MTPNEARQILGISSTDTQDEIKQAWKDLVFSFHPDRAGVGNEARKKRLEKKLKEVNMAYDILLSVQRAKKPTKTPKRPQPTDDWRVFTARTTKEGLKLRKEAMKKYNKEYQEKNKEKLKALRKEYQEKNKEKLKALRKEYQEKNKEKLKEIQKEWREKTKKRLKEYRKELKKKSKQTFP